MCKVMDGVLMRYMKAMLQERNLNVNLFIKRNREQLIDIDKIELRSQVKKGRHYAFVTTCTIVK